MWISEGTVLAICLVGFGTIAPAASLTNANVQSAVDQALSWTRKGGVARVMGVQELAQQNEARADIRFDGFQYNANNYNIPMQRDEVTPPEPSVNSPTFYQDMANIPARQRHVAQYSGQGVGLLKHYNDGRWVLTEVQFNFVQVNCNIQISDTSAAIKSTPPPANSSGTVGVGGLVDAAQDGDLGRVKALIASGVKPNSVVPFGGGGRNPLAEAARRGRLAGC